MATETETVHGTHGHHELEHPRQMHHFDTMDQQKDASGLGMWVFLIQEIMFFGGLFVAYLVYRNRFYAGFGTASSTLRTTLGAVNTVVLIGSSLTMALAVNAAQRGLRDRLMKYIVGTMILGSIFLGVKVIEYSEKYERREVPGQNFCFQPTGTPCVGVGGEESLPELLKRWAGGGFGHPPAVEVTEPASAEISTAENHANSEGASNTLPENSERARSLAGSEIYFSLYFAMTGTHALHMIVGMGIMLWLLKNAHAGVYSSAYYTHIENFGLYWHFVDIVWIYLFPLLYLINLHAGKH